MTYPTLERYQEALQFPGAAFVDSTLQKADVKKSGLGMPLALCGGFALTYTVATGTRQYAVRCFHKKSSALEARYAAISKRLKLIKSPYFVDFEFQSQGIRIDKQVYPVVKMAWAAGETLGEFLEANYTNQHAISALRQSLLELATYLDLQKISHGDIQTGNLMVSEGGKRIQLIDYDGMYVDELKSLGSTELGHRNFQHPDRSMSEPFDTSMDRFSFISLSLALKALEIDSHLWSKTKSDIDGIIFRANDFSAPETSQVFSELLKHAPLVQDIKNFIAVCKATYGQTPSLADFLTQKKIPALVKQAPGKQANVSTQTYLGPYSVLEGSDYEHCVKNVGNRVELIGRIIEVRNTTTRFGKPYVFLNFGPWRGKIVKITIWSTGLATFKSNPDDSWIGKWISVVGLMEPPYARSKYPHPTITVSKSNELSIITHEEAQFRLGKTKKIAEVKKEKTNEHILEHINAKAKPVSTINPKSSALPISVTVAKSPLVQTSVSRSTNELLLEKIKQKSAPTPLRKSTVSTPSKISSGNNSQSTYNSPTYKKKRGLFEAIFDFFFK